MNGIISVTQPPLSSDQILLGQISLGRLFIILTTLLFGPIAPAPCNAQSLFSRLPSGERFNLTLGYETQDEASDPTWYANNMTDDENGNMNWRLPTLGGKQVWTDHRWWYGWRVQHNLLTDHWRLLDERNVRHAWGTRQACEAHLQEVISKQPARQAPEKIVVLMHGLMRSSDSMNSLGKFLRTNGYPVVAQFGYASSRASIADHAQALREYVASFPGNPQLYFIGHSMGNIVLRHAIGDWEREAATSTLKRIESVVMLGPPNQGAAIARRLSKIGLFGIITGEAGLELGPAWEQLETHLSRPPCRFGIVVGDMKHWGKFNPLIEGPSDMIVTTEEAQLDGVTETLVVPDLHSFLMDDSNVHEAIHRFFSGKSMEVAATDTPAVE